MGVGKLKGGKFGGDPTKGSFDVWRQKGDYTCGAACLKMLEHWATAKSNDEEHWRKMADIGSKGITPQAMKKVLKQLPLESTEVKKSEVESWREGIRVPRIDETTVYLLSIDAYVPDGRNLGHWIILLDLFPSIENERGRSERLLAWYADPMEPEEKDMPGKPVVWPWTSLLHAEIREGFCLKK